MASGPTPQEPTSSRATRANRRRAERRFFKTTVFIHPGEQGLGPTSSGRLINVSTTGAAVLARGSFTVGEGLYLALLNPRRETIREVQGTIRWLHPVAHDVFRFGFVFTGPLTSHEVSRIR